MTLNGLFNTTRDVTGIDWVAGERAASEEPKLKWAVGSSSRAAPRLRYHRGKGKLSRRCPVRARQSISPRLSCPSTELTPEGGGGGGEGSLTCKFDASCTRHHNNGREDGRTRNSLNARCPRRIFVERGAEPSRNSRRGEILKTFICPPLLSPPGLLAHSRLRPATMPFALPSARRPSEYLWNYKRRWRWRRRCG